MTSNTLEAYVSAVAELLQDDIKLTQLKGAVNCSVWRNTITTWHVISLTE